MSIPACYLGSFHNPRGDIKVVFKVDSDSDFVQYQLDEGRYWHRMPFKDWYWQVDNGTWIPDVPEYMRVSEGL